MINFLMLVFNVAVFSYNVNLYGWLKFLTPENYQIVLAVYLMSLKLRFRQWYGNVVERVDNGQYIVTLLIEGKLVKIVIEHESPVPIAVLDDKDADVTQDALPFFRMRCTDVGPDFFFCDKMSLVYKDSPTAELRSH